MKIRAFTLAELMIVMSVIGILAAVLIPIANNARPDENVMKLKKANITLGNVIRELVTSDKYYCNGDLGIKADCKTGVGYDVLTTTYFCETVADILTTKEVNCAKKGENRDGTGHILLSNEYVESLPSGEKLKRTVTAETTRQAKIAMDDACKKSAKTVGKEIVTPDGITYYVSGMSQFGSRWQTNGLRMFSPPGEFPANFSDNDGFDIAYRIICIDVDGIPDTATETDCVNECPFGYGVRADGKMLPGARAEEWLEKSIQKGGNK